MSINYILVYVAHGRLEADMTRLYLESAGLSPLVRQESAGMTYGLTVGPLGEAQILVPENQVDIARKMLKEMENGEVKFEQIEDMDNQEEL